MIQKLNAEVRYRWRLLVLLGAAIVFAALALIASSAVVGAAGGLLTVFLAIWLNPAAHSPPRPDLKMIAIGESRLNPSELVEEIFRSTAEDKPGDTKEAPRALTVGLRRRLDLEATLAEGLQRARGRAPGRGPMANLTRAMSPFAYAEPTSEDHERYEADVVEYGNRLRGWLEKVEEYLEGRSRLLVARIELSNEARLDAENARVVLRFPASFSAPGEEMPVAPDAPAAPSFPLRPSPLQQMLSYTQPYGPSPSPVMPFLSATVSPSVSPLVWAPNYERLPGGELQVDYRRQTIHHGESASPGDPLIVLSSEPGGHRVAWEIHAANLPSARRGVIEVSHLQEPIAGAPITTLGDLEAVLEDLQLGPG